MMINMNSLRAFSTALVIGCSINSAYADTELPKELIQKDRIGKDWTYIQSIDGTTISYSIEIVGQERFLSIQFSNTTSETTDFIWSMTKNNSQIQITADEMVESRVQLDPYSAEIIDGSYVIEMAEGDQFSDFIVSIQPTKH